MQTVGLDPDGRGLALAGGAALLGGAALAVSAGPPWEFSPIREALEGVPVAAMAALTGLSEVYCQDIRAGRATPHTRHWEPLRKLASEQEPAGWIAPERQTPVTLALDRAMVEALEAELDHWQWSAQAAHLESVEGRQQAAHSIGCIGEGAEDLTHTITQAGSR